MSQSTLILLVTAATWSRALLLPNSQPITPPLSITDQLHVLQRLFLEQQAQLSEQAHKLSQQEAALYGQEDVIRVQGEKLASQEQRLRQQESELSETKLELSQTQAEVSDIRAALFETKAELSRTKSMLGHLEESVRLSKQDSLQSQQRPEGDQHQDMSRHQTSVTHQYGSQHSHAQHQLHVSQADWLPVVAMTTTDNPNMKAAAFPDNADMSFLHAMPRSDDRGPLEVVVSQLSQQVTQMTANMQAYRTQTDADLQTIKNTNIQQNQDIQDAQSSTFIHWGSSQCGSLSQIVYSGVVGGSFYNDTGAATNYLCLTMSPVFSSQHVPPFMAFLYGTEYETGDSHQDKDPVCAVCRSMLPTTVMIPGTNVCSPGWRLHYSGYLMTGHPTNIASSEYICVDSKLQSSIHGDVNENGKLLYYTVSRCGSLPCQPYVNNKVVTCAVCGK